MESQAKLSKTELETDRHTARTQRCVFVAIGEREGCAKRVPITFYIEYIADIDKKVCSFGLPFHDKRRVEIPTLFRTKNGSDPKPRFTDITRRGGNNQIAVV